MSPVGGRALRSGQLDADVDDVIGGDIGGRLKVTCRGRPRCDGGGARTGGTCATGRPLRGGLAGSVSAGVLAALRRPPSPPAKSNGEYFWWVFHVVIQKPPNLPAVATRHPGSRLLGERAG